MPQSIHIDIIDQKALKLLQDLEQRQLIRLHNHHDQALSLTHWATKYKEAMTKQPLSEVDQQLNELREGWQ